MKKFEEMHLLVRYLGYLFVASIFSAVIFVRPSDSFDELKNSWGFFHMVSTLTMGMSLIDMVKSRFTENSKADSGDDRSFASDQFVYLVSGVFVYMITFGLIVSVLSFL